MDIAGRAETTKGEGLEYTGIARTFPSATKGSASPQAALVAVLPGLLPTTDECIRGSPPAACTRLSLGRPGHLPHYGSAGADGSRGPA